MDIKALKPVAETKTTQMPLSQYGLPITEDTSIVFRGGANADYNLGREAAMGLKSLTGYAGTDFTITSGRRGEDHPLHNPHSLHATGNAIDFGVKSTDGKAALNFFFNDDEYTELSDLGRQYLIDNNAELIDERSTIGSEHFHLEFNSPEQSRLLGANDVQDLYGDGYTTGDGFPAFGVMGTYKENDYNTGTDYLKELQELAGVEDHVDIGPTSDFFKEYGISAGKVKRTTQAKGLLANAKPIKPDPEAEDVYTPRKLDPYTYYSTERSPIKIEGSMKTRVGQYGKPETIRDEWQEWSFNLPFVTTKSESDIQEEYRKQGVTMWPGTSKSEAAADLQRNWGLYGKWPRGGAGLVETIGYTMSSTAASIFLGLPNAMYTGDFTSVYANPVNQSINEYDGWFKQEYPHHATAADQVITDNAFDSWSAFRKSLTTANFWSRDFLQGVGFLAGAAFTGGIAAELGIGRAIYMTGAGVRRAVPRMLADRFRKQVLKSSFKSSAKTLAGQAALANRANIANYITAGLISAAGEASIEAGHIYKHSFESLKRMRDEGVEAYQGLSDNELRDLAGSYSDVAWLANVAVVGSTNLLMFRHLFGGGYKNLASKMIKRRVTRDATKAAGKRMGWKPRTKAGKVLRTAYLGGRQTVAEGWEEWSQYGIELGGKDYFKYQYIQDHSNEVGMIQGLQGIAASISRGFLKTPETKEGLQGIFLGMLLGSLGGTYSGYKGTHAIQDYSKKVEATKGAIDELNILEKSGELYTHVRALSELQRLSRVQLNAVEDEDKFKAKTAEAAAAFAALELLDKTGQMGMIEDVITDISKLSDEEFAATFELDEGETKVETLKEINRVRGAINNYKNTTKGIDPIINGIAARMALSIDPKLSEEQQKEKLYQIEYLKNVIKYNSFMSDHFDERSNDILAEISKLSQGHINLAFMREIDMLDKGKFTDVQQQIFAQVQEMIKSLPKQQLSTAVNEYIQELTEDFGFVNLMRQTFARYANQLLDNPEKESKEAVDERKQQEKEGLQKNKDVDDRAAAEEAMKQEKELEAKLQEEDAAKNKAEVDRLNKEQQAEQERAAKDTKSAQEEDTKQAPATEDPLAKKESEKANKRKVEQGPPIEEEPAAEKGPVNQNQPIENLETPNNTTVSRENAERAEDTETDGKALGKITYLGDILSAAWKSFNNLFNGRGTDKVTTNYLENPDTGNIAGALVTWSLDMEELERTAGGGLGLAPAQRISAKALDIIKNKGELSETDLDNIPIKGIIKKDGETLVVYVHRTSYVKTNMNPKQEIQEEETAKIRKFRRSVYNAINEGKPVVSRITEMYMGHLNTVKDAQYPISLVVNGGKPGAKIPIFMVSDGQNYLDENGQQVAEIPYGAKQESKGAVYFKLTAANGEIFPARAFIADLHRETAELIYDIYKARMDQQIALTTKLTQKTIDSMPDTGVLKSYKKYLTEMLKDKNVETPTFADVINMLIYDKSKNTPIIFKPFVDEKKQSKQSLTLATNKYTYDQMESKKEEIIDWIVENKRYNINKSRLNGRDNFRYNNWLLNNKIVYTNIFANSETKGAFVQPTLRFSPLIENAKAAPETTVAPKAPTKGSFAGMTVAKDESIPEAYTKAKNETESEENKAELDKIIQAKEEEAGQMTINFGGVDVTVVKDETAPVLPESENTVPTLPTEESENTTNAPQADIEKALEGEKESVSPNQVTKGVDLKSLPKRKKPKGVSIQKIKPSKDQLKDDC